ncbi:MAG: glycosyltransferase family 4 protein [Natronincolaceae bacterium]
MGGLARPYEFSKQLKDRGYKSTIFASAYLHYTGENLIFDKSKYIEYLYNGIPFIFVRSPEYKNNGIFRIYNMIFFARNLFRVSKVFSGGGGKPDIIYASSPHPLTLIAGIMLGKKFSIPCICEVRDLWPESFVAYNIIKRNNPLLKLLYVGERWIYKKADKLIFTMEGGSEYITDKQWDEEHGGPIDLNKVYHINNGIDLEKFNENKGKCVYNDVDLDDESAFKVLYAGSMGQANALRYLVESAKIIQDKDIQNIKFILFGDGYQRQELEQFVKDNDLQNIMFKGRVEKKYIPNILSKSNLNVFTGKYIYLYKYGLSLNKMFDYFASGKPTVSNVECGYDMLEKYNCGITVQGGSPGALAEGILKFYNMPKEEYNMHCQNALRAAKDFDFKVLTDELEKTILELAPGKGEETYANTTNQLKKTVPNN